MRLDALRANCRGVKCNLVDATGESVEGPAFAGTDHEGNRRAPRSLGRLRAAYLGTVDVEEHRHAVVRRDDVAEPIERKCGASYGCCIPHEIERLVLLQC